MNKKPGLARTLMQTGRGGGLCYLEVAVRMPVDQPPGSGGGGEGDAISFSFPAILTSRLEF